MALTFSRSALKTVVAQICQTIGWHGIHSTPLEIMVDMLQRYLTEVGKLTHLYSEQFGHTMPNLDDVGLAFRDMNINLLDLEEYIRNVDSVPCVHEIPKYPIPRDSHLNFLKPGSREVVTRPVHVHEHLPPMHPEMEEEEYGNKQTPLSIDTAVASGSTSPLASPKGNVFKRPGDPISLESPAVKRARCIAVPRILELCDKITAQKEIKKRHERYMKVETAKHMAKVQLISKEQQPQKRHHYLKKEKGKHSYKKKGWMRVMQSVELQTKTLKEELGYLINVIRMEMKEKKKKKENKEKKKQTRLKAKQMRKKLKLKLKKENGQKSARGNKKEQKKGLMKRMTLEPLVKIQSEEGNKKGEEQENKSEKRKIKPKIFDDMMYY